MSSLTSPWHLARYTVARVLRRAYGADVARLNLRLSDDLYTEVARGAARAGLHPASYSRERLAWAVGFAGADDLRRDVARFRSWATSCGRS